MLFILLSLFFLSALLTLFNWKYGVTALVTIGFLQDPLRKLVPGEPAYVSLSVGLLLLILIISFSVHNRVPNILKGNDLRKYILYPLVSLLILLAVQFFNSLIRHDSLIIPVLGLFSYVLPLMTITIGYEMFSNSHNQALKLFGVYALLYSILIIFLFMEYYGIDLNILGEVGEGIIIYDLGTAFRGYTGLMRSPDIAAWHAASAIMFLTIVVVCRQHRSLIIIIALLLLFVGGGILTGRRKFIAELLIFGSVYWFLLSYFQQGSKKLSVLVLTVLLIGYLLIQQITTLNDQERFVNIYLERGKTVFADMPDRFKILGLETIVWAYYRTGLTGAGLGASTPGARHFTEELESYGGAGEGGLGKIMLELGIMGLITIAWFSISLFRYIWISLQIATAASQTLARLSYGLFAYLIANIATFIVATQVYNDLFVVIVVALITGYLLAVRKIAMTITENNIKHDITTMHASQ